MILRRTPRNGKSGLETTKNLINKRKEESDFADVYGAFSWIYKTKNQGNIDGIWYLPAKNEALLLSNMFQADQSGFNAILKSAGFTEVWGDADYLTSTEADKNYPVSIRMNQWPHSQLSKDLSSWGTRVRAIAEF